ncbi:MAG: BatA domain-containing protein, partial [Planctomycetota bacterium]
MSFVNVSLLAGTALVAIPIVLHLIMRQRPRHFEFPAIRFIQKRHDVNRRRLRLRHLVLLVLRALAIVLLAAALARPSVKLSGSLGSQEAPVAAALVFDASMRMDYHHENRTRLEAAQELGLWLAAQLPPESQIAVLDTGPGPAAFQVDRGAAEHRIRRLATTANSQALIPTLDKAVGLLEESELARRELYLFTDLARVSWPGDSAARVQQRLASLADVGIYVIDVGVEDPVNSGLGELRLSGQVLSSHAPLRIETELFHRGPAGERTVELCLLEADPGKSPEGVPAKQKTLRLEPGQAEQIDFEIGNLAIGTQQGYVRIVGQD